MADPITLAAIGAVGGAALKPSNPLQGAMLGGIAGFTGGTALGVGAAGSAGTAGSGLAMGAKGVTGLTSGTGAALNAGANAANAGLYSLGGTTAGLSAVPASASLTSAVPGASYSLAAAPTMGNYSLVAPSAVSSVPAPSFMDKIAMSGKSAYENPMMTASALNATQGLLTPEQMPSQAPAMPLQAGRGVKPYDPMASLDPYKQSVVGGQPISLI
jgi:hypothetical protein